MNSTPVGFPPGSDDSYRPPAFLGRPGPERFPEIPQSFGMMGSGPTGYGFTPVPEQDRGNETPVTPEIPQLFGMMPSEARGYGYIPAPELHGGNFPAPPVTPEIPQSFGMMPSGPGGYGFTPTPDHGGNDPALRIPLQPLPQPGYILTSCSILLCIFSQQDQPKQYRLQITRSPAQSPTTPANDSELFYALKNAYNHELRSFWQRYFSLKGLKYITVLEYTVASRPTRVEIDVFARNDIMYAFKHPNKVTTESKWINWIFELKSNNQKKYALEFVEGWKGEKIMILGAVPWVGSCLTAIIWTSCGGDVQVALAVASFILTASGSILALLAILSSLGS